MSTEPNKSQVPTHWMSVVVTVAVLGTALFVIVRESADATSRLWATGIVGTIVGYWLRGADRNNRT